MGLVDGRTIPTLLRLVQQGTLKPEPFGTHTFTLDNTMGAYDVVADADKHNADKHNALKVVMKW